MSSFSFDPRCGSASASLTYQASLTRSERERMLLLECAGTCGQDRRRPTHDDESNPPRGNQAASIGPAPRLRNQRGQQARRLPFSINGVGSFVSVSLGLLSLAKAAGCDYLLA